MEDDVLANAGVDVFEEVFKLIFTKLYDEMTFPTTPEKPLRFRNANTAAQVKKAIQTLFEEACKRWPGVFADHERIKLTSEEHLKVCAVARGVEALQLQPRSSTKPLSTSLSSDEGRERPILHPAPGDRHVREDAQPR